MPRAKFQIERKCKICGKPFMALIIESQYCSPACGQKAYKIRKREQKRNEELQQVIEGLDSDRDFITVPEAIALFEDDINVWFRDIKYTCIFTLHLYCIM